MTCKRAPEWDNGYFYIADNSGQSDVKILMDRNWSHKPLGGMGHQERSKTLAPAHYGETRENPKRSWLLLRAWMLCRANLDGWATSKDGRSRQFQEDYTKLGEDIRKRQPQEGGLLGNPKADAVLKTWLPGGLSASSWTEAISQA